MPRDDAEGNVLVRHAHNEKLLPQSDAPTRGEHARVMLNGDTRAPASATMSSDLAPDS